MQKFKILLLNLVSTLQQNHYVTDSQKAFGRTIVRGIDFHNPGSKSKI